MGTLSGLLVFCLIFPVSSFAHSGDPSSLDSDNVQRLLRIDDEADVLNAYECSLYVGDTTREDSEEQGCVQLWRMRKSDFENLRHLPFVE